MENKSATGGFEVDEKLDLNKIMTSCRICMSRDKNMSGLFEQNINEEILFCTGVCLKNENDLPNKICSKCLKDLHTAYKFKMTCLSADERHRKQIYDCNVKVEDTAASDEECGDIQYDDEIGEQSDEQVIQDLDLVPIVKKNVRKENKVTKEKTDTGTKVARRPGRPKTSDAPPRVKKFKFKKLHCESCDIKFENKQQCDKHKKQMHKDSQNWVCEICGKLFIHRSSHYSHVKSHLPPKYACDQCEYKTWHKYDLVKHIRIHTGIKTYQCTYCPSSYYTSSNLTGHIRRNHMKLRPFQCSLCRMAFADRTKLNRHIDSHNEVKRYECEVCHECFTRRWYWKKHLLRQHDIVTPPQRPGRQKINAVIGEHLIEKVDSTVRPTQKTTEYINASYLI